MRKYLALGKKARLEDLKRTNQMISRLLIFQVYLVLTFQSLGETQRALPTQTRKYLCCSNTFYLNVKIGQGCGVWTWVLLVDKGISILTSQESFQLSLPESNVTRHSAQNYNIRKNAWVFGVIVIDKDYSTYEYCSV